MRGFLTAKSAHLAAIPVLAILLALASLLIVGRTQNAADQAVVHANEVQASSEGALTLLVDAETGVRGFQATGETSFLEPYDLALAQLPRTLSTLKVLVGEEPAQAARVHQVESLTTSELATLESLRKQEAIGAGRDVRSLGLDTTGKSTMNIIRGKVSAIESAETQVQQSRQAQYHDLENLVLAEARRTDGSDVLVGHFVRMPCHLLDQSLDGLNEAGILGRARPPGISLRTNAAFRCHASFA